MSDPVRAAALGIVLAVSLLGCSSGGSTDPNAAGRRTQAVEELQRSGLTKAQAGCMADRLGPEVVVDAPDMPTLAQGRPYQDAAKTCIGTG
jgi:hypothetical protein